MMGPVGKKVGKKERKKEKKKIKEINCTFYKFKLYPVHNIFTSQCLG